MRIGSHYRTPTRRFLPALLALVYAGVLTGGLFAHMVEEGEEVRTVHAGEPLPWSGDVPDDLDCLLCQVLGSPGHPAPEAPAVAVPAPVGTTDHLVGEPVRESLSPTRQARAPPLA